MAVREQEETSGAELETDGGNNEDEEEAEVGAEGADEVDEGEHSHGKWVECWGHVSGLTTFMIEYSREQERTETGLESGSDTQSRSTLASWREEAECVEHWDESCRLCQEMSSVAEEDQHGKGVAEEEFTDTSQEEQDTAEPYAGSGGRNTEAARTTPVHWQMLAGITKRQD